MVKKKNRILNGGHRKIVLGGPKVREARKVSRNVKTSSLKMVFAHTDQKRMQAMIAAGTKTEAKNEK